MPQRDAGVVAFEDFVSDHGAAIDAAGLTCFPLLDSMMLAAQSGLTHQRGICCVRQEGGVYPSYT